MANRCTVLFASLEAAEVAREQLIQRSVPTHAIVITERLSDDIPIGDEVARGVNIGFGVTPTPQALEAVIEQHAAEVDATRQVSARTYVLDVDTGGDFLNEKAVQEVLGPDACSEA